MQKYIFHSSFKKFDADISMNTSSKAPLFFKTYFDLDKFKVNYQKCTTIKPSFMCHAAYLRAVLRKCISDNAGSRLICFPVVDVIKLFLEEI